MSNELTLNQGFAVARTSKAGKTTYRGALGVITSGNVAERTSLASEVVDRMVDNNNFFHLMREVVRVFPVAFLKKSGRVFVNGDDVYLASADGGTLERLDCTKANKATMLTMANAAMAACLESEEKSGKEIKGERAIYRAALTRFVAREIARAEELAKIENAATETEQA